jgi:hypothetical protein
MRAVYGKIRARLHDLDQTQPCSCGSAGGRTSCSWLMPVASALATLSDKQTGLRQGAIVLTKGEVVVMAILGAVLVAGICTMFFL